MRAAPERLAFVALSAPRPGSQRDAVAVVDVDPGSRRFGQLVGQVTLPQGGNGLHHLGWSACSSRLCPHARCRDAERRYLVAPGSRSSRIHVVDTRPDPRQPALVKVIEADVLRDKTGYSAPHIVRSGPEGVFLGARDAVAAPGPGGLFRLDPASLSVTGPWDRDPERPRVGGDFGWHRGHDTLVASGEGPVLHFFDAASRAHLQGLELGPAPGAVTRLRPAHDPRRPWGFAAAAPAPEGAPGAVWLWYLEDGGRGARRWGARKVIGTPGRVTDLALALDDRVLYLACGDAGELRQYEVVDPFRPRLTGQVRIGESGGPYREAPAEESGRLELSRDGRRLYLTGGRGGWMTQLDAHPAGGIEAQPRFQLWFEAGKHPYQVRLEGGDSSSDSYCYS